MLLVGSGPIVIGQASEFDYSGTQAAKALREEGIEVVLVNSNPATIMTDPGLADRTYIEPLAERMLEKIIAKERPDALLPTMGGQTALNLAVQLAKSGVLDRHGVRLIGASLDAIEKAEDRERFRQTMRAIGLPVPESGVVGSLAEAWGVLERIGYPVIIRPCFTLGGTGGSVAYNRDEFVSRVEWALSCSPTRATLLETSCLGWKEFELEVVRDRNDNVIIVCSIENFDPMGIHTGDSITVAPQQTLTDKEYQRMRDAAIRIIRAIGVDTGGCNIQFAVEPRTGELTVVEMNPRVSRSSALASKATGFPIARIAAKLAIGYTLDELDNDITRSTRASFEPSIDYVVTKIPRFTFEKFEGSDRRLSTQMKSVGEVMAIGRTFKESLGKALRSLEVGTYGLEPSGLGRVGPGPLPVGLSDEGTLEELEKRLMAQGPERIWIVAELLRRGATVAELNQRTGIDPWFLANLEEILAEEAGLAAAVRDADRLLGAKRAGLSDRRIAELWRCSPAEVRELRAAKGVRPVMKRVDTCAGEIHAETPYLYSTYELEDESRPSTRDKVIVLGGGPNRIGQGIEFDYCCVHAVMALREEGLEAIMVNCNPETVSTDFDVADRLYFEPLTLEDVLHIVELERPRGVIVQYGGQTPLKLAGELARLGVPVLGTTPDAIDRAEDRVRFAALVERLGLRQPANGSARSLEEGLAAARRIGYPVIVRPSYVLGGRAMEICHDEASLTGYLVRALAATPDIESRPVLIDAYLSAATEYDVDAVSDGERVVIGAVLEHIEEAGIHSGDSAMATPPHSTPPEVVAEIEAQTIALARELGVVGLMNVQFARKGSELYILEVNPRASRTVPFVSKVTGVPLAKIGTKVMAGRTLAELGLTELRLPTRGMVAVKESVFPFAKFSEADVLLGPEMKSTGEVMGIDRSFARAFAKASIAAGMALPRGGRVFVSVADEDKPTAIRVARQLVASGFRLLATGGTERALVAAGLPVERVNKVAEGRPHIVDRIVNGEVQLVINTTVGRQAILDSFSIRRQALLSRVPYFTTMTAAWAAAQAIDALAEGDVWPCALQDFGEAARAGVPEDAQRTR